MNRAVKRMLQKDESEGLVEKQTCGHDEGTICLKCATKEFNDFQSQIRLLKEEYAKLNQRLEILQGRSDKPLCWQCKYGTCVKIKVPNSAALMQSMDKEVWQDGDKEVDVLDLWSVVCSYPGHIPGLMPNRFVVYAVLDCNNFEERKDKTKKSKKKTVK